MDSTFDKIAAEVGAVICGVTGWIIGRHFLGVGGAYAMAIVFGIAGWAIGAAAKAMGLAIPLLIGGAVAAILLFHTYGLGPPNPG